MSSAKIKSATALRSDLYDTLKEVSDGDPQIITHKQGAPVVLVSKEDFDKMLNETEALKKMAVGLSQIEEGKGIKHKSALKQLRSMQKKWK